MRVYSIHFCIKNRSILTQLQKNLKIFQIWFHKILIIIITVFLFQILGSCKTCKCPAYSQIKSQNSENWGHTAVKTGYFF